MRVRTIAGMLALTTIFGACSDDDAISEDDGANLEAGGASGESATGGRAADTGGQADTGGRSSGSGGSNGTGGSQRGGSAGEGGAGGAESNEEGGAAGASVIEAGAAGAAGSAGDTPPPSDINRWWRTVFSLNDLIVIENDTVTQFHVLARYEWDGLECFTDFSTTEPIEIRDKETTFLATSEDVPGASLEFTIEFGESSTTLHLGALEYEGEATCPGQDPRGVVSVSFEPVDYSMYVWRNRTGPPIEFAGLGAVCDAPGCPLIGGEVSPFCDPASPTNHWWTLSGLCDGSDLDLACTGMQQNEKRCSKYCETDADCAGAEIPMGCNLNCDSEDGSLLNTCVPIEEDVPC